MMSDAAHTILCLLISISWLFVGYLIFAATFILLRILSKLKNEVFNESNKIKPKSDHVILITGATSGIGLALAKYFYRRGFSIIATRLSENEPDHLTHLMSEEQQISIARVDMKPKIFFIDLDVRFQDSINNSYIKVKKILKDNDLKLYALVNNAGVASNYFTRWEMRSQLVSTIQVNLLGPLLMVRQYTPLLAKTPGSRIVNLGSVLGLIASNSASYSASKAGLDMLSHCFTVELKKLKIKSVVIYVGNLIKNTSILKNSSSGMEQVYNEFTDEERVLYDKDFKKHVEYLRKNDLYIEKSQSKTTDVTKEKSVDTSLLKRIFNILKYTSGTIDSKYDLADTYLMKSFDNAICLKNPPNSMYGGNFFYTIFSSASFLEFLSAKSLKDLCDYFERYNLVTIWQD